MGIIVDSGTIISYASGLPAQLATRLGDPFLLRIIGFGSSISNLLDTTIDLTGGPNIPINLAFSVPRDGSNGEKMASKFKKELGLKLNSFYVKLMSSYHQIT